MNKTTTKAHLNNTEKSQLEYAALNALAGTTGKLEHGFRINSPKGQLAAIYWSNLKPGNDVEIALAEGRLSDYPLPLVQSWVEWMKSSHPNDCEIHKHHSNWPIIGFKLAEAHTFLKELRKLRVGWLTKDVEQMLNQRRASRSPAEIRAAHLKADRESLLPTRHHAVIDLVKRAGISIKPWYEKQDGTDSVSPRSNPAYCYNWVFGGKGEPTLACVWHETLKVEDDGIQMRANLRDLATRLEEVAADAKQPEKNRKRARQQAPRARQFDEYIAAASGKAIRTIVLEGNMRRDAELGNEASEVRVRLLDPVEWVVQHHDALTGEFLIRRRETGTPVQVETERFADQHDVRAGTDTPESKETTGKVYQRSAQVRDEVLERTAGHCELCNTPGFTLPDGRLYVETHHVQPLSEQGADRAWNVAALCPSHHREAHYGAKKAEIRATLENHLATLYPPESRVTGES